MTPDQFATLSADAILAWVRARKIEPPDVYYSNRPGEYRAAAFSIAGIASADQLQSVLDSLSKAIGEGQTFRTWKRSIREAGDAPDVLALGRARLDNIFRTNLQGSYMRGLYERQAQTVASRPFLMYDAINDDRVRPSHLALDNYIAPADSSFWRTHSPPLGFRCRCSRISLTEAQARARGWAGQSPPAAGTPDEGWDYDKADGIKPGVARAMKRAAAAAAPPIAAKLAKIENTPPPPQTLDDFLALGKEALVRIEKSIPVSRRDADGVPLADAFAEALRAEIRAVRGAPAKLKIANSPDPKVVARMNDASAVYPAEWIEAANRMGKLRVRGDMYGGRGWHYTVGPLMNGTSFRISNFGRVSGVTGEGYIFLSQVAGMSSSVSTAIHEIAHRIQSTFPRLDDLFQTLHARKTVGDPLVPLSKIHPGHGYRWDEVTKPDHLPNAYFGKLYKHESGADPDGAAKEMITMSFEALLHGHQAFTQKALLTGPSRDLAELAVAVLLHWKP